MRQDHDELEKSSCLREELEMIDFRYSDRVLCVIAMLVGVMLTCYRCVCFLS